MASSDVIVISSDDDELDLRSPAPAPYSNMGNGFTRATPIYTGNHPEDAIRHRAVRSPRKAMIQPRQLFPQQHDGATQTCSSVSLSGHSLLAAAMPARGDTAGLQHASPPERLQQGDSNGSRLQNITAPHIDAPHTAQQQLPKQGRHKRTRLADVRCVERDTLAVKTAAHACVTAYAFVSNWP